MPSVEDPEDFGLVGGAVSAQNAAVLAAQASFLCTIIENWLKKAQIVYVQARIDELENQDKERKAREDEIALEKIAQAYRGRPLPEDW